MTSITYSLASRGLLAHIPDLGPQLREAADTSPPLGRFTQTSAALRQLLAQRAAQLEAHNQALRSHRAQVLSVLDDVHRIDDHLSHSLHQQHPGERP